MEKIVPFEINYKNITTIEKYGYWSLILSALAILILWFFPENNFLETSSIILMISYLTSLSVSKYLFKEAEKKKREDLIDNSFSTSYSDLITKNYYNNDDIPPGAKKLAVNTYESSFHTENTLRLMVQRRLLKFLIFALIFLISAFTEGGHNLAQLLFKISIPIVLLTNLLVTLIFYFDVKLVNEKFKSELNHEENEVNSLKNFSRYLIPVFEYYTIKAWANVNLDETIFKKNNEKMSEKWVERKKRLNL